MPYALVFIGYTLILLLDKVLFDSHALFEGNEHGHIDPAEQKLHDGVKRSFAKADREAEMNGVMTKDEVRKSM